MAVTQGSNASMPAIAGLDELVTLKMRLKVGIVYLQTNWRAGERFTKGRARVLAIAEGEYLPRLAQLVDAIGLERIEEQHSLLQDRLNRGWDVSGERADELFAELLTQYEVLMDALRWESSDPRTEPLSALHARIDEIAAVR